MSDNKQIITNFVNENLSSIPTLAHQNIILKGWLIKVADAWAAKGGDPALLLSLKIICQEDTFRCQKCDLVFKKSERVDCWKCKIQVCEGCEKDDWLCKHLSRGKF